MRSHQQSRGEARPTSLVESKSLDAACFIFVSRTPVIGREDRYFALGNEYRTVDCLVTRQSTVPVIVNIEADYIAGVW
jgi:hypothetical protein